MSTASSLTTTEPQRAELKLSDIEIEAQKPPRASHWQLVSSQTHVTEHVLNHTYLGMGTTESPFIVDFIPHDPRNPLTFKASKKWFITFVVAIATMAVAFVSSAYSGGQAEIIAEFGCSQEVATLGISLFVLGFAIGPLIWAPMSELYGRQWLFIGTYAGLTAFNAGAAGSQNIWTLIILRFLAGSIGSSPLVNGGGCIADMFSANERGLATALFAAAPFLGPSIGPIVGGFVGQTVGWRWVQGVMAIFTGVITIVGALTIPETYAPTILKRRAKKLGVMSNGTKVYVSRIEVQNGEKTAKEEFKIALSRPWVLLFTEPIVLALSIYMAIIYGTLYLMFGAFPIVFQGGRGWSPGVGGLAFLGVAVGMICGVVIIIPGNKMYIRKAAASPGGIAPPEERLPPAMIGSIALPIGLFWFAWTNQASIHWIVCIIATAPFGFGMVLVFLSTINYLVDTYTIYASSVLAANSVLRSLFGAAFPLFTSQMYANLGIHWASSIPAFLALGCVPLPFLFYKYGPAIRQKCKYAAEAQAAMADMRKPVAMVAQESGTEIKSERPIENVSTCGIIA